MKNFYEFTQLLEAGVAGTKYGYCPTCSKQPGYRPERINPWSSKVQRCRHCGDGLFEKGDVSDNLIDRLRAEIAELKQDPETKKGRSIADEINVSQMPEEEVCAHYGVTPEEAKKCMDKFALLALKYRKLKKLDPSSEAEWNQKWSEKGQQD
jgi:hypothetical protein